MHGQMEYLCSRGRGCSNFKASLDSTRSCAKTQNSIVQQQKGDERGLASFPSQGRPEDQIKVDSEVHLASCLVQRDYALDYAFLI